jgi:hypothetical protein
VQDIEEMKEEVFMHWEKADEYWQNGKISVVEMENLNDVFSKLLCILQTEQRKIYMKTTNRRKRMFRFLMVYLMGRSKQSIQVPMVERVPCK